MNSTLILLFQIAAILPKTRIHETMVTYMVFLMLPSAKHTQKAAARFSGKSTAAISRFLLTNNDLAQRMLKTVVKHAARELGEACRKAAFPGSPWTVLIAIDSTLHRRYSKRVANSQFFNHGSGSQYGHQWTNVCLIVAGQILPLPPIPFLTKGYCKKKGIAYQSESKRIMAYLQELDLTQLIGLHKPKQICALLDSGYDNRALMTSIVSKGWDFVIALKKSSTARPEISSPKRHQNIVQLFSKVVGNQWFTVRGKVGNDGKRRMDFRTTGIPGYLSGFKQKVLLVASEKARRAHGTQKYFACSRENVDASKVIKAYRERWAIEVFHKDVKSQLGLEDAGVKNFDSLQTHVSMVYCAHIALRLQQSFSSGSIVECRAAFERDKLIEEKRLLIQLSSRFEGADQIKSHCLQVIEEVMAA